jgi:hypothetical protein
MILPIPFRFNGVVYTSAGILCTWLSRAGSEGDVSDVCRTEEERERWGMNHLYLVDTATARRRIQEYMQSTLNPSDDRVLAILSECTYVAVGSVQ